MNREQHFDIYVYADWETLSQPCLMGVLQCANARGKEVFSFEYDEQWLLKNPQVLDPNLGWYQGIQYAPQSQQNFGIFLDSSPAQWGRFLMKRREAQLAREDARPEKRLLESDFLLGVYDASRMGGLRFKLDPNGSFIDNTHHYSTPPWTSLRALENASFQVENNQKLDSAEYNKWLNMLVAPGGSLGGARPKANVVDELGHLWIAKFPSKHDEYDIAAFEMLAHVLAEKANITTPNVLIKQFNSQYHTFLSQRFDRIESNQRRHFASAMTLLGHHDGDDATTGVSYLELVEFISSLGYQVEQDLHQLWRRIVFNISISNTDDHLRNHGFLFKENYGWALSPAYDMNPIADSEGLKLNISETDNAQDFNLALEVCPAFRLSKSAANAILKEVIDITSAWQQYANKLNIPKSQQTLLQSAFRLVSQG